MRGDIKKVVFERAKSNRTWASKTVRAKRIVLDSNHDQLNEESNHTRRKRQKHRNEHYNAIEHFLTRNVGKPWNKVYAEICRAVDSRSLLGAEIRTYVRYFVSIECWLDGKKIMKRDRIGRAQEVRGLFVHPKTGMLMRIPDRQ